MYGPTTVIGLLEYANGWFQKLKCCVYDNKSPEELSKMGIRTFQKLFPSECAHIDCIISCLMRAKYCAEKGGNAHLINEATGLSKEFRNYMTDNKLIPYVMRDIDSEITLYKMMIESYHDRAGLGGGESVDYWNLLDTRDGIDAKIDFLWYCGIKIDFLSVRINNEDGELKHLNKRIFKDRWVTKEYTAVYPKSKYWWQYLGE